MCAAVERSDETPPEIHHEGPPGTEISRTAESAKAGMIGSTDSVQAASARISPLDEVDDEVDYERHSSDQAAGSELTSRKSATRHRYGKKRRARFHRLVDRLVEKTWEDPTLDLRAELPPSTARSEASIRHVSELITKCVAKKVAEDCAESSVRFHPDAPQMVLSV
mmetsp:Transcript_34449/g.97878  ORF Transcript_34449/g.97878 Transcript_34449/m.97878 type:complete len:166 (-) Transcript_34449:88-585(-)